MYDNEVITDMYEQIDKLSGMDLYVNLNFDKLSDDDKVAYVIAAKQYMSTLDKLANKLTIDDESTIMCHEIIFDKEKAFDPYDNKFLIEYPLNITKYVYGPVKKSCLGIRIRELSRWFQVYVPDPHGNMTEDMAIERAVDEVQNYIYEDIRKKNEWLVNRGKKNER